MRILFAAAVVIGLVAGCAESGSTLPPMNDATATSVAEFRRDRTGPVLARSTDTPAPTSTPGPSPTPTWDESGCADYMRVVDRLRREFDYDGSSTWKFIALEKGITSDGAYVLYIGCSDLKYKEQGRRETAEWEARQQARRELNDAIATATAEATPPPTDTPTFTPVISQRNEIGRCTGGLDGAKGYRDITLDRVTWNPSREAGPEYEIWTSGRYRLTIDAATQEQALERHAELCEREGWKLY